MYRWDFEIDDNLEESTQIVFNDTNKKIEEIKKMISEEITDKMFDDIEDYLYERFDNIREKYFDEVKRFFLDESNNEKLQKWLTGLNYTQETFRKKIYNDNKEVINQAIADDSVYEILKNMFENSYFKYWEFKDINTRYPQTCVIDGFLDQLIKLDGFNEELKKRLDKQIQNKIDELQELKQRVNSIQQELENITG